jgi:hypothetical protein
MEWFDMINTVWDVLYPILLAAVPVVGVYALRLRSAIKESRDAFLAMQTTIDEAFDVIEGFTGTINIADDGNIKYDADKLKNTINVEIPEVVSSWRQTRQETAEMLSAWRGLFKRT